MNTTTAREYANHFCCNPVEGLTALDIEHANREPDEKWLEFRADARRRLEQIMKDAAVFAAIP